MDVPYIILLVLISIMFSLSIYNAYKIYTIQKTNEEVIDDKHDDHVAKITDTLDDFKKKTDIVSIHNSSTSKKVENLENKISEISNKNAEQDVKIKKINENKTDIQTLSNIVNDNKTYIDSVIGLDFKNLKNSVESHSTELSELKNLELSKLSNKVSKNTEYIDSIKGFDLNELKRSIESNGAELSELEKLNLSQMRNQVSENSLYVNDILRFNYAEMESNINKNISDITNNKTDITNNKTDITNNKTDITNNKTDITNNKTDININTSDINKLMVTEEDDNQIILESADINVDYNEILHYGNTYEFKPFKVKITHNSIIPDNIAFKLHYNESHGVSNLLRPLTSYISVDTFKKYCEKGKVFTDSHGISRYELVISNDKNYRLYKNYNTPYEQIFIDSFIVIDLKKYDISKLYEDLLKNLMLKSEYSYILLIRGTRKNTVTTITDFNEIIYSVKKNVNIQQNVYDRIINHVNVHNNPFIGLEVIELNKINEDSVSVNPIIETRPMLNARRSSPP